MNLSRLLDRPDVRAVLCGLVALVLGLCAARPVHAQTEVDPPGRVGRLAEPRGTVSWFDLEQGQWAAAQRNRPLTAGDRVATGRDSAVELRIGSTTFKLGEASEVELLRLDDERVRVQLHRGSLALRLRSTALAAETEFGTEEAWLQPRRGGLYRLDREDDTTSVASWRGELAVVGEPGLAVDAGRQLQLWREGPSRGLVHRWTAPRDDAFAARVLREDRDEERSASAAHVSPEMTGFEDLDRYGRWDRHPDYGAVWAPQGVGDDWVPYRHGRWEWVSPWGWTWIDDAPWGFAPFHYGRWVMWRNRWVWVPGSYVARPVFAPALVAWIDGPGVGIGLRFGGPSLSWVPLAPWEPFHPHYRVSPGYHDRVNTPDHRRWRPPPRPGRDGSHRYWHQGEPGAVTMVPADVRRRPPPRPTTPMVPLPSRPQPALQAPVLAPLVPAAPPPMRLSDPTPTRPVPPREERDPRDVGGRPRTGGVAQPDPNASTPTPAVPLQRQPGVTPPPPPPVAVTPPPPRPQPVTPLPSQPQPQPVPPKPPLPQPVQPVPPRPPQALQPPPPRPPEARPQPPAREREKERDKEEPRTRGNEGRAAIR